MGWAVSQIVDPYHPEGVQSRPTKTEVVHWVFDSQQDACRHKAALLLRAMVPLLVQQVEDESWSKKPSKVESEVAPKG